MTKIDCPLSWLEKKELQWEIDSPFMVYLTAMTRYLLNPDEKLPPRLKENSSGYIFVSNINNLGTKVDFKNGRLDIDIEKAIETYKKIQNRFAESFNPDDNLTFYPINIIKSSNSSKFIHGLPYRKILWKRKEEFEENPDKLKKYIEEHRKKLHIDDDVEIVSTKIRNWRVQLRMKVWGIHDVTMQIGYPTKSETRYDEKWNSINMIDPLGNLFSPQWVDDITYNISDEKIKELADNAHENWAKFMMNFFAWRAPEYVTEENYKHYYYEEIGDNMPDTDEVNDNAMRDGYVLHRFSNNKLVRIKLVWWENNLAHTQDQLMPNYWNKEEKENFNYWKKVYQKNLHNLIDLGVDSFRIDLAHGFGKEDDFTLFKSLIKEATLYAKTKYNKKISFTLETYDYSQVKWEWKVKTTPESFLEWNNELSYPAIKVYHKKTEEYLLEIWNKENDEDKLLVLDKLMEDFRRLFQDPHKGNYQMMTASSFDDFTLSKIAETVGIEHKHIEEFKILLGKACYNVFSLDRDFLWDKWEIIPSVPGGHRVEGEEEEEEEEEEWKVDTHTISNDEEFLEKISKDPEVIFYESEWIKILNSLKTRSKVTGLSIIDKKLIFTFRSGRRRIFDFEKLIKWWIPYTEYSVERPKKVDEKDMKNLKKLEEERIKAKNERKSDNKISDQYTPYIYDYIFWQKFTDYITTKAYHNPKPNTKPIRNRDREKLEAYFQLNREELIKEFFNSEDVELPEEYKKIDNSWKKINILRVKLQESVDKILKKTFEWRYSDLVAKK